MMEKELVERLGRLERDNRRLKRVGCAAVLGILSIALLAAVRPPDQSNVVNAQQIIVRDPINGSQAVMDGEGLTLYDASGKVRVELRESKTEPKGMEVLPGDWLKLYDSHGRPGVELTEEDPPADFLQGFTKVQTSGNLVLLDYEGESVSAANLGVGKTTGLWLTKTHLKDSGWPEADDTDAAVMIGDSSAGVRVEEQGITRIGLFARGGMPGLDLADTAGYETQIGVADIKYPATGQVRRTSAASIVMLGDRHHVIWKAP